MGKLFYLLTAFFLIGCAAATPAPTSPATPSPQPPTPTVAQTPVTVRQGKLTFVEFFAVT